MSSIDVGVTNVENGNQMSQSSVVNVDPTLGTSLMWSKLNTNQNNKKETLRIFFSTHC